MKKLLLPIFILLCYFANSQYNPSGPGGTPLNRPIALTGKSDGARTMLYDATHFTYRAFVSVAEANSYILGASRLGWFPVAINTGGTLLNGVITGGTNSLYFWRDGIADVNLIPMNAGGSTNTSIGSGLRLAVNGTNNIKSVIADLGTCITIDSSVSGQVRWQIDTACLVNYLKTHHPFILKVQADSGLDVSASGDSLFLRYLETYLVSQDSIGGGNLYSKIHNSWVLVGSVGGGGGSTLVYNTVAEMLAVRPSNGTGAITLGFTSAGDGGGENYTYNSASTATSDNMTIFTPTTGSGAGRYLISVPGGIVTPRQLGIFPSSDNTVKLNAANVFTSANLYTLYFDTYPYVIDPNAGGITILSNMHWAGLGKDIYTLIAKTYSSQNKYMFQKFGTGTDSVFNVTLENLGIDSRQRFDGIGGFSGSNPIPDTSSYGFALQLGRNIKMTNVNWKGFTNAGVYVVFAKNQTYTNMWGDSCGRFLYSNVFDSLSSDITIVGGGGDIGMRDHYDALAPAGLAKIRAGDDIYLIGGTRINVNGVYLGNRFKRAWESVELTIKGTGSSFINSLMDGGGINAGGLSTGGYLLAGGNVISCDNFLYANNRQQNVVMLARRAQDSVGGLEKYTSPNILELGVCNNFQGVNNSFKNVNIIIGNQNVNTTITGGSIDNSGSNTNTISGVGNLITTAFTNYTGHDTSRNTVIDVPTILMGTGQIVNFFGGQGLADGFTLKNSSVTASGVIDVMEYSQPSSGVNHKNINIINNKFTGNVYTFAYTNAITNSTTINAANNDFSHAAIIDTTAFSIVNSGVPVTFNKEGTSFNWGVYSSHIDQAYTRNDSLFNLKNGIEVFQSVILSSGGDSSDLRNNNLVIFRSGVAHDSVVVDNSHVGVIYNKSTWTNLSDFVDSSSGATVTGGKIVFSGGSSSYTKTLGLNIPSALSKFKIVAKFTLGTINSSNMGIGIGAKSANTFVGIGTLGRTNFSTTGSNGWALIDYDYAGSITNQSQNLSGITASTGDNIILTLERKLNTYYFTVFNQTTGATLCKTSASYGVLFNIVTPPGTNNTCRYSIYNFGTNSFTLDSLSVSSTETTNGVVLMGDSRMVGYGAGDYQSTVPNQVALTTDNVVVNSGGGDRVTEALIRFREIVSLDPKLLIIGPYSVNDFSSGQSLATVEANYDNLIDSVVAAGIPYKIALPFYTSDGNSASLKSYLVSTYPGKTIDTWTATNFPGSHQVDNVHLTAEGYKAAAATIVESGYVKSSSTVLDYVPTPAAPPGQFTESGSDLYRPSGSVTVGSAAGGLDFNVNRAGTNIVSDHYVNSSYGNAAGTTGLLFGYQTRGGVFASNFGNISFDTYNSGWGERFKIDSTGKVFAYNLSTGAGNRALRWNSSTHEVTVSDTSAGGGSSQWTNNADTSIYFNTGNVGLGTTTPSAKLHTQQNNVDGNIDIKVENLGAAGTAKYGTISQLGSTAYGISGWESAMVLEAAANGGMALSAFAGDFKVQTGTSRLTRMKIDNSGVPFYYGMKSGTGTPFIVVHMPDSSFAQMPYPGGGTTLYSGDGTLAANRTVSAGGKTLTLGAAGDRLPKLIIDADSTIFNGRMGWSTATTTDANYTIPSAITTVFLASITANRTLTLPTPSTHVGQIIFLQNQNTALGKTWGFAGNVTDAGGNTVSSIPNSNSYTLICNGTSWAVQGLFNTIIANTTAGVVFTANDIGLTSNATHSYTTPNDGVAHLYRTNFGIAVTTGSGFVTHIHSYTSYTDENSASQSNIEALDNGGGTVGFLATSTGSSNLIPLTFTAKPNTTITLGFVIGGTTGAVWNQRGAIELVY